MVVADSQATVQCRVWSRCRCRSCGTWRGHGRDGELRYVGARGPVSTPLTTHRERAIWRGPRVCSLVHGTAVPRLLVLRAPSALASGSACLILSCEYTVPGSRNAPLLVLLYTVQRRRNQQDRLPTRRRSGFLLRPPLRSLRDPSETPPRFPRDPGFLPTRGRSSLLRGRGLQWRGERQHGQVRTRRAPVVRPRRTPVRTPPARSPHQRCGRAHRQDHSHIQRVTPASAQRAQLPSARLAPWTTCDRGGRRGRHGRA